MKMIKWVYLKIQIIYIKVSELIKDKILFHQNDGSDFIINIIICL